MTGVAPITLVVVVLTTWDSDVTTYPATTEIAASWAYAWDNALTGVLIALVVSSWFVPRAAATITAVALQPWVSDAEPDLAHQVLVVGAPLLVALDVGLRVRQWAISRRWIGPPPPRVPRPQLRIVDDASWMRSGVATLLAMLTVGTFGWYLHERHEILELGDRTIPSVGVVTATETFDDVVTMRVGDDELDFWVRDASVYPVGSEHRVFVDPTGDRRPYGEEDADPDERMAIVAASAGLAVLTIVVGVVPARRRRRALDTVDGTAVLALAREHPTGDGLEIFALDDPEGTTPLAYLPARLPLVVAEPRDPWRVRARDAVGGLLPWVRERVNEFFDGAGEWDDEWDEDWDEDDEDWDDDEDWYPTLVGSTPVQVRGLTHHGSVCVVELLATEEEGETRWAHVRPARDRWTAGALWLTAAGWLASRLTPHGRRSRVAHANGVELPERAETYVVARLLRATAVAGPVLLGVGSVAVAWWMLSEEPFELFSDDVYLLVGALGLGWVAGAWWNTRLSWTRPSRYGLRIRSTFYDDLAPGHLIGDVRRLRESISIDLEGEDTMRLQPPDDRDQAGRQSALDEAHRMAVAARDTPRKWSLPPAVPRVLPSSATVVAISVAVAVTIAMLTAGR